MGVRRKTNIEKIRLESRLDEIRGENRSESRLNECQGNASIITDAIGMTIRVANVYKWRKYDDERESL